MAQEKHKYFTLGTYAPNLDASGITANRTYTFPDASGTLAFTSGLQASYLRFLLPSAGVLLGTLSTNIAVCTDSTAANMYVAFYEDAGTDTIKIYRYTKDTATGMYVYSGDTVTLTKGTDFGGNGGVGICSGGTYVWFVGINTAATDVRIIRFDKNLSNKTSITVGSGWPFSVAQIGYAGISANDTTMYISANGGTGFSLYTISGTSATASGVASTRTSSLSTVAGAYFDDTYIYQMDYSNLNDLKKYDTSGALQSTTDTGLFEASTAVTALGSPVGIGFGSTGSIYIFSISASSVSNRYFLDTFLITKP